MPAMPQDVETTASAQADTPSIELRLPDPVITPGQWPSPQDKLGRCAEIENLTPVLLNAQAPLVFVLEAPWGGGKTTFIKLWQQYLASQGQVSLTLNAWESDFCDDPLLPMLSTLDSWLSDQSDEGTAGKAWKKAKGLAPSLLKASAVAAVKVATLNTVELDKAVEGAIASATGEMTGNLVDAFNSKMGALKQFKTLLAKALAALPDEQPNLIIFVDELDRCRPSYAIEVLERIKHLFDIERVVFVLAVNREQLGKSLQGVYGPAFDGEHYLKRFIDLDYQLQVPNLDAFIDAQLKQEEIQQYFAGHRSMLEEFSWVKESFFWLCGRFNYQLRDVNQLITRFRLILRSIPRGQTVEPQVLSAMLFLRENNPDLYHALRKDTKRINEAIHFLLGRPVEDGVFSKAFPVVAGVMLGTLVEEENRNEILKYWCEVRDKFDEGDDRNRTVERLRSIAAQEDSWEATELAQSVYERIELLQQIDISR